MESVSLITEDWSSLALDEAPYIQSLICFIQLPFQPLPIFTLNHRYSVPLSNISDLILQHLSMWQIDLNIVDHMGSTALHSPHAEFHNKDRYTKIYEIWPAHPPTQDKYL